MSIGPNTGWNNGTSVNNGIFQWAAETPFASITDGLSNTIMLGEKVIGNNNQGAQTFSSNSIGNTATNCAWGANLTNTSSYPNNMPGGTMAGLQAAVAATGQNSLTALIAGTAINAGCCDNWAYASANAVGELAPPNWQYPNWQATGGCGTHHYNPTIMPPRSRHPGGVNIAMGDASVRFVTQTVDPTTWASMGCRNDGNPVTLP
jgi:prepilin-type processing-associated H-X9-DG protein